MAQLGEDEEEGADGLPLGYCDIKHCPGWLCRSKNIRVSGILGEGLMLLVPSPGTLGRRSNRTPFIYHHHLISRLWGSVVLLAEARLSSLLQALADVFLGLCRKGKFPDPLPYCYTTWFLQG